MVISPQVLKDQVLTGVEYKPVGRFASSGFLV